MARVLILIILIWLLVLIIKRILANANASQKSEQKPEQRIVQCVHCGCHVPESESQLKNGQIVCNNPECQKIEGTEN